MADYGLTEKGFQPKRLADIVAGVNSRIADQLGMIGASIYITSKAYRIDAKTTWIITVSCKGSLADTGFIGTWLERSGMFLALDDGTAHGASCRDSNVDDIDLI